MLENFIPVGLYTYQEKLNTQQAWT